MSRSMYDMIIIGGGVIGLSIAYHLSKSGNAKILVLEKDRLGEGSTGRCAGGIRLQFATDINIKFSLSSLKFYEAFHEELGIDIGFKQHGYVFLATTPQEMEQFRANHALQLRHQIPVELMTPEQIEEEWPFLNVDDLAGGNYCSRDGYAGPYEVVQGFYRRGRERGVEYREGEEVVRIDIDHGHVAGLHTTKEHYAAGTIIDAAGPYSGLVAALAGVQIPVKPYRRQLFYTAPFARVPDRLPLIVDYHRGWYFRREGAGLLLAGSQDRHSSFDTHTDYEAMCFAGEHALHRVPITSECAVQGGWGGSYDMTPDCHAVMGEAEEPGGFYLACGFSGHGFMHAPAAGELMAELLLTGRARSLDIEALSPDRFRKGKLLHEPMTVFKED